MDDQHIVIARASSCCSACKLPEDVLAALHRDRFESGIGFETLAGKYALPERPLSESGVRRHFARHAPAPEDSPMPEGETPGNALDAGGVGGELDAQVV